MLFNICRYAIQRFPQLEPQLINSVGLATCLANGSHKNLPMRSSHENLHARISTFWTHGTWRHHDESPIHLKLSRIVSRRRRTTCDHDIINFSVSRIHMLCKTRTLQERIIPMTPGNPAHAAQKWTSAPHWSSASASKTPHHNPKH